MRDTDSCNSMAIAVIVMARSRYAMRSAGYVPKAQRKSPSTLQDCLRRTAGRPEALRIAYRERAITMTAMAKELQLSVSRISRLIAAAEAVGGGLEARGKT